MFNRPMPLRHIFLFVLLLALGAYSKCVCQENLDGAPDNYICTESEPETALNIWCTGASHLVPFLTDTIAALIQIL